MGKKDPIAIVLKRYTSEDIIAGIKSCISERSEFKTAVLIALESTPDVSSTTTSDAVNNPSSWRSLCSNASPSSPRAWMRDGSLGGFMQEKPATQILECWSLVILLLFNIIMLVTVSVSYYLSIGSGRVDRNDFYISSSIDTGLAHRIGALGISVAFVAYLLMMILRYVAIKALLNGVADAPRKCIARLSQFALVLEVLAALGAIGVGAFNMTFNYGVHMMFAADTFFCAVGSILVQSIIDEIIASYSKRGSPRISALWRICRWLLCFAAIAGLIGMFASAPRGYRETACLFELIMAIGLFTYYMTWAGSSGTGYIVGFQIFAYNRPLAATTTRLQIF